MGCWDVFCPLCGLPLSYSLVYQIKEKLGKLLKIPRANWTEKCTVLLLGKKAKHGFEEINCNITFRNKKTKEEYDIMCDFDLGIVLHTDCWKYASTLLKRKLTIDDFNLKKMKIRHKVWSHYTFTYLKYTDVSKYHKQDFNIEKLLKNPKNLYLLYSPLAKTPLADKNRKRIKDNVARLDKNKPKPRPSPLQSATLFKENTKMKGNDGKMYHVKTVGKSKRWVLIKGNR